MSENCGIISAIYQTATRDELASLTDPECEFLARVAATARLAGMNFQEALSLTRQMIAVSKNAMKASGVFARIISITQLALERKNHVEGSA